MYITLSNTECLQTETFTIGGVMPIVECNCWGFLNEVGIEKLLIEVGS